MIFLLLLSMLLICLVGGNAQGGDFADISIQLENGRLADLPEPLDGATIERRGVQTHRRYVLFTRLPQQFSIRITPKIAPLVAVVTVDGHNVLTGERVQCFTTKEYAGRGYIMREKRPYRIDGWQETAQLIRRFTVTDSWHSVAYDLSGDLADSGTIAISLFRQRQQPLPNVWGTMGTAAGERVHSPVIVMPFAAEAIASEVFALRYIGPREAEALEARRRAIGTQDGFIGLLPEKGGP